MRTIRMATAAVLGFGAVLAAPPAAAGGGCHEATEGSGTTVEMRELCFTPTVLRAQVGDTITFVNRDAIDHVVTGIGWGSAELPTGASIRQRFEAAGTYTYACYLHPSMSGAVVVGEGTGGGPVVEVAAADLAAGLSEPGARPVADPDPVVDDAGGTSAAVVGAGFGVGGLALGYVAARRRRTPGAA